MVLESGLLLEVDGRYELAGPLPPLAIPATLQDSLLARLDRLADAKEVAQLAAALGREFSYELLHAASPWDEVTLQHALARLVEAELLFHRGLPPQASYVVKHALIQDAAYESLLMSRRQQFHVRIAQILEARFPDVAETQPEVLAHHYTAAHLGWEASGYWLQAGSHAIERSAYAEAIGHLSKGLDLVTGTAEGDSRTRREVDLRAALGAAYIAIKGFGAPEVEAVYAPALALSQHLGDSAQLFPVLRAMWEFHDARAHLD